MQDTNWSQIEWELLSEEIELSPPWKADHFFNTFRLDMDGIYLNCNPRFHTRYLG